MPSSYTPNIRLEQQFTGENINTWGDRLNATFARVDDSVAGFLEKAITGDYTLQSANTNTVADEARRAHLKFTGALANNATITLPSVSKSYQVWNASGKTLTFTTGAGNTYSIENGDIAPIWCDGANVKGITYGGYDLKTYITSISASSGAVPGTTGHLGKFLKVTADGGPPTWQFVVTTDLNDYATNILGVQVALAFAAARRR